MTPRHLLSLEDLPESDLHELIERAVAYSANPRPRRSLDERVIAAYFLQTSTRTRTSFVSGALRLGANVISLGPGDLQVHTGESPEDTGRVLSGFVDALVMRDASAGTAHFRRYTRQGGMPVINAMSADEHPTQAITDLATISDHFGRLDGLHIVYVGEGNNTAAALGLAVSKLRGLRLTLLTPEGYGLPASLMATIQRLSRESGSCVCEGRSIEDLPPSADVVYTTRWQTTGTSKADPDWRTRFRPFQVTVAMMRRVSKPGRGTIFMHDLPAVRGEDVESEVIDGAQSLAFRQARFKLFAAMSVLDWCAEA